MKRLASFLLLCILLVLCSCQYSSMDVVERGSYSREATEYLSGELEPDYAMNDGTTIEPSTLVSTDDVTVLLLGVTNTPEVPELQMVFDKGNNEFINFEVDYTKVDGWQCAGAVFPPADAYMLSLQSFSSDYVKFPGELQIETGALVDCGLLDYVHEIEVGYRLTGPARTGVIAEGVYTAETSSEGEPAGFSCEGPILLEEDGIKVQIYSFGHGTYLDENCEDLILYIENNSDRRIGYVIDEAEKYDGSEPEKEKTDSNVIARNEKNGKIMTDMPMYGDGNVCAGSRVLEKLQTADEGGAATLSDGEVLSFSLKIYDYEEYDPDDVPEPLYEKNVTLTGEDMFASD